MATGESPNDEARLKNFAQDCHTLGCLRGFKYFEPYLRGKEELVVTVRTSRYPRCSKFASRNGVMRTTDEATPSSSPSSGGPELSPPLPPASPCTRESEKVRQSSDSVFLVGSYMAYGHPLVWQRDAGGDGDSPLLLETTERYKRLCAYHSSAAPSWSSSHRTRGGLGLPSTQGQRRDVDGWEVVAELVRETLGEGVNPFSVDMTGVSADAMERSLNAGALLNFLWEVYASGNIPEWEDELLDDMRRLAREHFCALTELPAEAIDAAALAATDTSFNA